MDPLERQLYVGYGENLLCESTYKAMETVIHKLCWRTERSFRRYAGHTVRRHAASHARAVDHGTAESA